MLGIFGEDVEITSFIENAGVGELVFRIGTGAAAIFFDEIGVGKFALRIFVKAFEVGAGGGGIEIVIEFLHVLAVVSLVAGEAEKSLLQNGIFSIPERKREAKVLMVVANAQNAVFGPAVGSGACVIMRKIFPSSAVGAVILPHIAPGPLGEIGTPALPMFCASLVFGETLLFSRRHGSQATLASGCLYLHSGFGHCATGPDFRYFSIK